MKTEIATNNIAVNFYANFGDKVPFLNNSDRACIFSDTTEILNLIMTSNRSVSIAAFDINQGTLNILKKISYFSDKMTFLYEYYGLVVFLNSENKLCIASSNNLSQTNILDKASVVDAVVFPTQESRKLKCLAMDVSGNLYFYVIDERGLIIHHSEIDAVSLESKLLVRGNCFLIMEHDRCIILIDEKSDKGNLSTPYQIFRIEGGFEHIDILNYDEFQKSLTIIGISNNEGKYIISTYDSSTNETINSLEFIEPALSNCIYDFGKYLCLFGKGIFCHYCFHSFHHFSELKNNSCFKIKYCLWVLYVTKHLQKYVRRCDSNQIFRRFIRTTALSKSARKIFFSF